MEKVLRVLIVEDIVEDADLMVQQLEKAGYKTTWQRVESSRALKLALETRTWDCILSDYSLPKYSGLDALLDIQEMNLDIPVIIISGAVGEDIAVHTMKAGASDYLMKKNLTRLVPALERELRQADLKRKKREFETKLELHKLILDNISDPVFWLNKDGSFAYVNYSFSSVSGFSREELFKMISPQIMLSHEVSSWDEHWQELVWKKSEKFKTGFLTKAGKLIPMEVHANYVECEGDAYYFGLAHDITKQLENDRALAESEERYRLLVEMSPEAIAVHQNGKFTYLNPAGAKLLGATYPHEIIDKPVMDIIPPGSPGPVNERIRGLNNGKDSPLMPEKLIRLDGSVVDVEIQARPFTMNGKSAVQVIARDITERLVAEKKLIESEKKYRSIIENAPIGIYQSTPDGRFKSVNKRLVTILGYDNVDELLDTYLPEDMYHTKEAREDVLRMINDSKLKGDFDVEVELEWKAKDGSPLWLLVSTHPVEDDKGETTFFNSFVIDITERRKLEQQIQQALDFNMMILGNCPAGILTYDEDGKCIQVNESLATIIGTTKDKVLMQNFFRIESWKKLGLFDAAMESFTNDRVTRVQASGNSTFGKKMEIDCTFTTFISQNKKNLLCFFVDISEQKNANEKLKRSEEIYRTLVETADDTILMTSLDGELLFKNSAYYKNLDYSVEENVSLNINQLLHPDDVEMFREYLIRAKKGPTANCEYRIQNKGGQWLTRFAKSSLILDEKNQPTAILSIIYDITERKQAEEKIREQLEELQRWYTVTLDREDRIMDLKKEVNILKSRLGESVIYPSQVS